MMFASQIAVSLWDDSNRKHIIGRANIIPPQRNIIDLRSKFTSWSSCIFAAAPYLFLVGCADKNRRRAVRTADDADASAFPAAAIQGQQHSRC